MSRFNSERRRELIAYITGKKDKGQKVLAFRHEAMQGGDNENDWLYYRESKKGLEYQDPESPDKKWISNDQLTAKYSDYKLMIIHISRRDLERGEVETHSFHFID